MWANQLLPSLDDWLLNGFWSNDGTKSSGLGSASGDDVVTSAAASAATSTKAMALEISANIALCDTMFCLVVLKLVAIILLLLVPLQVFCNSAVQQRAPFISPSIKRATPPVDRVH